MQNCFFLLRLARRNGGPKPEPDYTFCAGRNTVSVSVCTAGTVDRNPLCGKYPLRFPVSVAPTVTVDRNRSRITKKSNPVSVSVFPAVTETFLPRNQFGNSGPSFSDRDLSYNLVRMGGPELCPGCQTGHRSKMPPLRSEKPKPKPDCIFLVIRFRFRSTVASSLIVLFPFMK